MTATHESTPLQGDLKSGDSPAESPAHNAPRPQPGEPQGSASESVTRRIRRLEKLSDLLDRSIRLPGGYRVGLDGIIGLIPGIGDVSTFAVSAYIVNEARQLGVPKRTLVRMSWNVGVDTVFGAIPLVGDLFDFFHKANVKNIRLLLNYCDRQGLRTPPYPTDIA